MIILEFTLALLLQLEGLGAGGPSLYHRVGEDVFLPCGDISHPYFCRRADWIYTRDTNADSQMEVQRGTVVQSSPRAARLSVERFCYLIINNITAEDAGRYTCLSRDKRRDHLSSVFLSILTISASDSEATAGAVSLRCSLRSFNSSCPEDGLRWLDETGTELTDGADGYEVRRQTNCVSVLTTTRWSGWNRAFSCRFVEGDMLKTDAHYAPVSAVSSSDVGGNVSLQCSLRRHPGAGPCPVDGLRWVDETGTQLLHEDVWFSSRGQSNCVSDLTVEPHISRNRTFSCQFVEDNRVRTEAHYTPVLTDPRAQSPLKSIMWTLRLAGLILMMGVTVGLIRTRGCKRPLKESNVHDVADEDTVNCENVGQSPAAATLS